MRATLLSAGALALSLVALPSVAVAQAASDVQEARSSSRTGHWDEAEAAYRAALARADGADAVGVRRELADMLVTLGRFDDALEVAADGADARLANVRGEALRAMGRVEEAERAFRLAEESGAPDALVARKNRALLLEHRGERGEALRLWDTFIDVYNRGGGLSSRELQAVGTAVRHLAVTNPDLFQDALLAYDEAVAADPADLRPHLLLADLFLEKYNAPEAHASIDRLLSVNPRHPGGLVVKARILEFDGDGAGALERVRQAVEIAPEHAGARALLARLHLATEDYRRAREEAARALESAPGDPQALSVLAAAHYFEDDTAAWVRERDRLLESRPGYTDLFVTAAEIAERQRRYHDAVALAREAVDRDDRDARALGVLGMNELRIARIEEGRRHLERAFALDPYNPWYKNSLDLLDTFGAYETVRTEHFELFLHGEEAALLGPEVAAVAEEAYGVMVERYGVEPPTPVRVELFPSHADFSVRTLGLVGLGALGVSFGSTLVMDSPSARSPGDFNWASTLWHELAHAFHLGMTAHRVPRWFSEGLSVLEQRRARPHWGLGPTPGWLRSYAEGRMPPVSSLNDAFVRPAYPGQVVHGYYQASLVFSMIEERAGFDAVLAMLDGYRDGATTGELVPRVLAMSSEELDEAFDDWVRERYGERMAAVATVPGAGSSTGLLLGGHDEGAAPDVAGDADLDELRRAVRTAPGSYPARLALGVALHEAGDLAAAEEHLRAALRLFPEHGDPEGPLRWLARIHEERGELAEAAGALHALGRRGESLWEVHADEARIRLELGDTAEAAPALARAVEIVPFDVELRTLLADAYASTGEAGGEVRQREALLALDPPDRAGALYRLAVALRRAGEVEEARRRVLEALEIAPSYDDALELLLDLREGGS